MPCPGPVAILREAARLIRKPEDWRQGLPIPDLKVDSAAPYCVGTAVSIAGERLRADRRAIEKAECALGRAIGSDTSGDELIEAVVEWNDAPGRTHAEALAAIERARIELGGAPR